MDLRNLQRSKDTSASAAVLTPIPLPLGENEEPLTNSSEVKKQVSYDESMTMVPLSEEPEVRDTETPVHVPRIRRLAPVPGKSHEESLDHIYKFFQYAPLSLVRKPNRWQTLCNLQIPAATIVTGWNPKVNMEAVSIYNQTSSAGVLYVSPDRNDLQGSTIRGKGLNAGDQLTINVEAGGFFYAPSGATVDVIITWYEDEEARPI